MRTLLFIAALSAVGGCRTSSCKDGTIFLQLTFDGASAQADQLSVSVVVSGGATLSGSSARGPMGSTGTLEIDFGSGYPSGQSVTVSVTAFQGGAVVGMGSASTTLLGKCQRLPLSVVAGMPGDDMSPSGDLAGADLATTPDLSSCVPSSPSVTHWVDPSLGTDDASHGAQPGACAFKTITYALAHATGRINLANVAYTAPTEAFPLQLSGTQILDCDPNNTGTKASLNGSGAFNTLYGTIIISGTANQVLKCDVSSPSGTSSNIVACVNVNTSGPHVIDSSNLHNCGAAGSITVGISASGSPNFNGATVLNTTISGISNCINQIGNNWTVYNMSCTPGNDGVNSCGTGLAGCGNTITGGAVPINGCTAPSGFQVACPANTDMAH
jgi:hypothetical protein